MDVLLLPIAFAAAVFVWRFLAARVSIKDGVGRHAVALSVAVMLLPATIGNGLELDFIRTNPQRAAPQPERLAEAKAVPTERAKEIAAGYAALSDIPTEDYDAFHRCFGTLIRIESASLPIREALRWCLRRYTNERKATVAAHTEYDAAPILEQFRRSDGSHVPTESFIKAHMHEPDSYEHVETRFSIQPYDSRAGMIVATKFKAKDVFGAIVINTVKVRVDARTGEVLGFVG